MAASQWKTDFVQDDFEIPKYDVGIQPNNCNYLNDVVQTVFLTGSWR